MSQLYDRWKAIEPVSLSPRERVGQCLMLAVYIHDTEEEVLRTEFLIRNLSIGSLCFFRSRASVAANLSGVLPNRSDAVPVSDLTRMKILIDRYQQAASIPLLIAIDAEWGLAMRAHDGHAYPYALCLGALHKRPDLIEEVGRQIGRDCRELGIHWNLAPVVDLHLNPSNPVIGYRSFGSDPKLVADCAEAYRKGLSKEGVLHCIKHFPGHGDTALDSHIDLPVLERTMQDHQDSEEIPYRLLLDSPTDAVMAAHVAMPALTKDRELPASLSAQILEGYLRDTLKYEGLVISDALNMGSVSSRFNEPGELECSSFQAGCDVLCFPVAPEEAVDRICRTVVESRIDGSFQRLWQLKERAFRPPWNPMGDVQIRPPGRGALMLEIASRSLTLVWGNDAAVQSFMAEGPGWAAMGSPPSNYFTETCRRLLQGSSTIKKVLALFPPSLRPSEDFGWDVETWARIREFLHSGQIGVYLFGNPAILERIPWRKSAFTVLAYSEDPAFQIAAGDHLMGRPAPGVLPYRPGEERIVSYPMLGMMSGTSLDGLDLAFVEFTRHAQGWSYQLGPCETLPYPPFWRKALAGAIGLDPEQHEEIHIEYGRYLGQQARDFLERYNLHVAAIGSHGHTSHHRPAEGFTFQLGDGKELARESGLTVVCDFRAPDVALGGQGAPLVPIGDRLLFPDYDFCLNLGGISNISLEEDGRRVAYDIGMANLPLNYLCARQGWAFDPDGRHARSGSLLPGLLEDLDQLEYYRLSPPKSTGLEWVQSKVYPLLDVHSGTVQDQLHTLVVHNCRQIAAAVKRHGAHPGQRMLVTGGGARNAFFMDQLGRELAGLVEMVIPEPALIDYKEALVFALLAALHLEGEINVLSSVTGARRDHSSGSIFRP